MKTSTLLLSLTLSLVAAGCIATKDVGVESDASSGGSSSEDSGTSGGSMTSGASGSASTSGASDTATASGTATTVATVSGTATEATTGGDTGVVTMATATASDSDTDTFGGSESSSGSETDGGGEQVLCEETGGIWDIMSCGHYTCGLPPECAAIVPGCDCGVGSNFLDGPLGGCAPSEECDDAVAFSCGPDLSCSAPTELCDVFVPGVKGSEITYDCLDTPDSCSDAYTCGCIGGAGDCEKGLEGGLTVTTAAP